MRNYCTYFDKNYVCQGITVYESLKRLSSSEFLLWILCLDDTSYEILRRMNLSNTKLINNNQLMDIIQRQRLAFSSRTMLEYYYTCTAALIQYSFEIGDNVNSVTYIDADLYFFSDPEAIFKENPMAQVIIIEHGGKHCSLEYDAGYGRFNVCIVHFERGNDGIACLNWWADQTFKSTSLVEEGIYGDQKYLDEFPLRFKNVHIVKNIGICPAPWNVGDYDILNVNGDISLSENKLIAFHFARFSILGSHTFIPVRRVKLTNEIIKLIYLPYMINLRECYKMVKAIYPRFKFSHTWHDLKGSILGLLSGRAFYQYGNRVRRIGLSIPFGYDLVYKK